MIHFGGQVGGQVVVWVAGGRGAVMGPVLGGRGAQQAVRRGAVWTKVWVRGSMRGAVARGEPHPGGQQLVGGAVHLSH